MDIFHGEMPEDLDALLKLPGIGRYTASAIGSIAFGLPLPQSTAISCASSCAYSPAERTSLPQP